MWNTSSSGAAAGGGNQNNRGGGGGAGGLLKFVIGEDATNTGTGPIELTPGNHDITVGKGGDGLPISTTGTGQTGARSLALGLEALGGGGGGHQNGTNGGSGGGGGGNNIGEELHRTGGTAIEAVQGNSGGRGWSSATVSDNRAGGGGGGAGTAGHDAEPGEGGAGGDGKETSITGTIQFFAGGGGGAGTSNETSGSGGAGGGGSGSFTGSVEDMHGVDGTGGGGGGRRGIHLGPSGDGGSGIVVLRYQLSEVEDWAEGYALSGSARRVLVEDAVALRVKDTESMTILADGELYIGSTASLAVEGGLTLSAGSTTNVKGGLSIASGGSVGGAGTVEGDLTLEDGAWFDFSDPGWTLTVNNGTVSLGDLSVGRLILDHTLLTIGEMYTLIDGAGLDIHWGTVATGIGSAADIGGGKLAYFDSGSLALHVIPEPHTLGLLLAAGALLALQRRGKK